MTMATAETRAVATETATVAEAKSAKSESPRFTPSAEWLEKHMERMRTEKVERRELAEREKAGRAGRRRGKEGDSSVSQGGGSGGGSGGGRKEGGGREGVEIGRGWNGW
jgi:uncharacterized membrane protein YgcG